MIHIRVIRHSLRHLNLFSKEESIERIQCLILCSRFLLLPNKIGHTEEKEKSFQQIKKNSHLLIRYTKSRKIT